MVQLQWNVNSPVTSIFPFKHQSEATVKNKETQGCSALLLFCAKINKAFVFFIWYWYIFLIASLQMQCRQTTMCNVRKGLWVPVSGFRYFLKWLKSAEEEEKGERKKKSKCPHDVFEKLPAVQKATPGVSHFVPPCCYLTSLLFQSYWSPIVQSNTPGPLSAARSFSYCLSATNDFISPKWLFPLCFTFICFFSFDLRVFSVAHLAYIYYIVIDSQDPVFSRDTSYWRHLTVPQVQPKYSLPTLCWTHFLNIKLQPCLLKITFIWN